MISYKNGSAFWLNNRFLGDDKTHVFPANASYTVSVLSDSDMNGALNWHCTNKGKSQTHKEIEPKFLKV